jgi:carboxyl-terminal processing protease
MASIGLIIMLSAATTGNALADGPQPPPTAPEPAPAMPPDLARQVQEITEVVLENHIDPPARQQMILSGIKALDRVAGVPTPPGLGRRVSEITTPEQLAALLKAVWPKTTAKPVAVKRLEEALFEGLLGPVPGGAHLMTAKERNAAEQIAGNRYVGILVALSRDEKEQRPVFHEVMAGGPADRAGVKKDDLFEEVDGVDTKGMELREVVERTRGDEGTDVTIKVRNPKEAKARTLRITRGRMASDRLFHTTVEGVRKLASGDWKVRLDVPDPIGYVKLNEIGASTPHELRKLASRMESEGVRALAIDLRGAGAGGTALAVHSAVLVADNLLERGAIGRVRTVRGETTYQADSDALFRGWPIAVLVDQNTSGAAEWIAAALQDNHRATIVGWPTRGAQRATYPDGLPFENARYGPYEAAVRSSVPVGDGRWWISMATGSLGRGDGRSLADRDAAASAEEPGREKPKGGVQPDRGLPPPQNGFAFLPHAIRLRRAPDQKAETPTKPADKPDSSIDPALNAAVKALHEALAKP